MLEYRPSARNVSRPSTASSPAYGVGWRPKAMRWPRRMSSATRATAAHGSTVQDSTACAMRSTTPPSRSSRCSRPTGVEVAFLHHPISEDPNDQLLLQIQGAIAEYERAVLAERFRRGKLQKARDGHIPSAKAPYGYRYEPRRDAVPARLVVDEAEADMVRQLHAWVMEEGLTVRQCVKRLNAGPWVTRSGRQ